MYCKIGKALCGLRGGGTKEKGMGERRRKGEKERKRIGTSRREEHFFTMVGGKVHANAFKAEAESICYAGRGDYFMLNLKMTTAGGARHNINSYISNIGTESKLESFWDHLAHFANLSQIAKPLIYSGTTE